MENSNPINTLIEANHGLGEKQEKEEPVDQGMYQRMVGKLICLLHIRLDIAYVMSAVSQFMHAPFKLHLEASYKIVRYLKGTPGKGLLFQKDGELKLEVYTNVDWLASFQTKDRLPGIASSQEGIWLLGEARNN